MAELREMCELLDRLTKHYEKPAFGESVVRDYHAALSAYPYRMLEQAAVRHLKDKKGHFFPKVCDFIRHIEGADKTAGDMIAAARLSVTPLGVLCRLQIGEFDLKNANDSQLMNRGRECVQMHKKWLHKCLAGAYSVREVRAMRRNGVDPFMPFDDDCVARPINDEAVRNTVSDVVEQDIKLVASSNIPQSEHDNCDDIAVKTMTEIMESLGYVTK